MVILIYFRRFTRFHLILLLLFLARNSHARQHPATYYVEPLPDKASDFTPVERLLARGDSAYAAFDNRTAVHLYEGAFSEDSTDFRVLERLARTCNDYGQDILEVRGKKEAEPVIKASVRYAEAMQRLYPERAASWFQLAATLGNYALFKGGREKVRIGRKVKTYMLRSIEIDSSFTLGYVALGIFNREVAELNWIQRTVAKALFGGAPGGTLEESEAYLKKALRMDPYLMITPLELGKTYLKLHREDLALEMFARAHRLKPVNTLEIRRYRWAEKEREKLLKRK